ncbi:hypothetical protein, partial [Cronobacter sakazakii]|uniref:hypothetical protein n=1 Tax=Cronobacter sakazakii TaxID=28141 RepID=UPI002116B7EC
LKIENEKCGVAHAILAHDAISIRAVSYALTSHITNIRSYLAFQCPAIFNFEGAILDLICSEGRARSIAPIDTMMLLKSGTSRKHYYTSDEREKLNLLHWQGLLLLVLF